MEMRRKVRRRLLAKAAAAVVIISIVRLCTDLAWSNGGSLSASMAVALEVFFAKNSSYGSELLHTRDSCGDPGTAHADAEGIYGRKLARKKSCVVSRGCGKKLKIAMYIIEIFEEARKMVQPRPDYVSYSYAVSLKMPEATLRDMNVPVDRSRNTTVDSQSCSRSLAPAHSDSKSPTQWIFLNPLTKELWLATVCFVFFTGFVFWVIERSINPEFQGSSLTQFSTALYFVLSTLTFSHGQILRSPLSKIVLVVWCIVVLVLVQSYVANLSSMLAADEASPNNGSSSVGGSAPLTLRSFYSLFIVTGCISALMLLISLTRSAYAAYTRLGGYESQSTPQNDAANASVVVLVHEPVQEVARDNDSHGVHVRSAIAGDEEAGGKMQDSMADASEPAPDFYVQVEMTSTSNGVGGAL